VGQSYPDTFLNSWSPANLLTDDEHARALEEQWIEGDLTADTAESE
jgi:hypothetical protein